MSSTTHPPARTALHAAHLESGATLVDFHGWEMPIRYGSIPEEHLRVRSSAGLFDLGHMGRLRFRGKDATNWLERTLSHHVAAMREGDARYTLITKIDGQILDDAILYRLVDRDGAPDYLLVVNASNREPVIAWLESHRKGADARFEDVSGEIAMVAIQGPRAREIATPLFSNPGRPWASLLYYEILSASWESHPIWVARTGYTGEDGYEIYIESAKVAELWRALLKAGGESIAPIGLGARDTLRLEAGMPLYGNDIDGNTNPYEAGLGFAVKLDVEPPFVGRDALRKLRDAGPARRLAGFRVLGRRIARQGMPILRGESEVGVITSGAPSPSLGEPIALGYIDQATWTEARETARAGQETRLVVDVRGKREKLAIEALPFCSRTRKKAIL